MRIICRILVSIEVLCIFVAAGEPRSVGAPTSETPRAAIVGTVYDDANEVHASRVAVYRLTMLSGNLVLQPACASITDADGKYACFGLLPGKYIIAVQPINENATSKFNSKRDSYVFTLYPGTTDPDAAVPVRVAPGTMQIVDVMLEPGPAYSLTGTVPARRSVVSVSAVGSEGHVIDLGMHVMGGDGKFKITGLPAGTYNIRATWLRDQQITFGTGQCRGTVVAVVTGDYKGLEINDTSMARVEGHVISSDPEPRSLDTVALLSIEDPSREFNAKVSLGGYFVLVDVPPGRYRLRVNSPGEEVVQGLEVNSEPQSNRIVTVVPGQEVVTLAVEVSSNVSTVRGSVAEAGGLILAQSEGSGEFYSSKSDDDGNYSLTGLGPGRYYLYAWSSPDGVEYANPRFLAWFAAYRSELTVGKGTTITGVQLETADAGR
jgi:hypothetical protein